MFRQNNNKNNNNSSIIMALLASSIAVSITCDLYPFYIKGIPVVKLCLLVTLKICVAQWCFYISKQCKLFGVCGVDFTYITCVIDMCLCVITYYVSDHICCYFSVYDSIQ